MYSINISTKLASLISLSELTATTINAILWKTDFSNQQLPICFIMSEEEHVSTGDIGVNGTRCFMCWNP